MARKIENLEAYERATRCHIRNNANKTWVKNFARAAEVEDWLRSIEYDDYWCDNEFAISVRSAWNVYGKLSDGQSAAICKIIDKAAARKAEWAAKRQAEQAQAAATSNHIGVVGERQQFELKVVGVYEYDKPKFHYHDSSVGYITVMEDDAGNRVVYMNQLSEKGEDDYGYETWRTASKGDTVLFMAKVKSHGERDGVKQTIVQRPTKIVVIAGEE